MRIVRMQLGNEYLDLTEYLAPRGRSIPADSRSNDLWFQHIAIVVRDMDQAFEKLRALKVQRITRPERYWLLAQTGDELLDYREAVALYAGAQQTIIEGGDHGFQNFEAHLPDLLRQ